jgi:ribosomal protein L23
MMTTIPITSEKALTLLTADKYMFYVPMSASKNSVAKNIASQFKVTVVNVDMAIRKGKPKRFSRGKHRYPGTTFTKDRKIAYITLKAGDKIRVFDEEPDQKPKDDSPKTKVDSSDVVDSKPQKTKRLFAKRRTGNRGDK